MKKHLLLFALLGKICLSYSQEVRYIAYPRNAKNAALYDTTQLYGFYSFVQAAFDECAELSPTKIQGISNADCKRIREAEGENFYKMPGMIVRLGPQSDKPLANKFGEDSLSADGTAFIYPPPDTIFLLAKQYDEIVFKERLEKDTLTGKEKYIPVEIILKKRFRGLKDPIVTARLDMELLLYVNKTFFVPFPEEESDRLIGALETYLSNAERRFGPYGLYDMISAAEVMRYSGAAPFFGTRRWMWEYLLTGTDEGYPEMLEKLHALPDICYRVDSTQWVRVDRYGEDSVYFDPVTQEWLLSIATEHDTVFYVKSGFEKVYEFRTVAYNYQKARWEEHCTGLEITKKLFTNELPVVVYSQPNAYAENFDAPLGKNFYPNPSEYIKYRYRFDNSPLLAYLRRRIEPLPISLDWQEPLFNHKFSWKKIHGL